MLETLILLVPLIKIIIFILQLRSISEEKREKFMFCNNRVANGLS